jgi:hypothetical protein
MRRCGNWFEPGISFLATPSPATLKSAGKSAKSRAGNGDKIIHKLKEAVYDTEPHQCLQLNYVSIFKAIY